ncbi:hypothetical protein E1262_25145 [Jiangella aurantiaca]|uniref:Uncharacterized protein n=1 Tax=Jiangella aurantiaca TaxID=2530373 RepID=A0A4R5A497_9ACTN|nr:hypothetical protein [Jiangella aurantiaca]TDD65469.1 hypothetical protein E1262_25145 [Jiangella aurantiaca]
MSDRWPNNSKINEGGGVVAALDRTPLATLPAADRRGFVRALTALSALPPGELEEIAGRP